MRAGWLSCSIYLAAHRADRRADTSKLIRPALSARVPQPSPHAMARKKLLFRLLDTITARSQVYSAILLASAAVCFAILPLLAREPRLVEAALLAGVADTQCVHCKLA